MGCLGDLGQMGLGFWSPYAAATLAPFLLPHFVLVIPTLSPPPSSLVTDGCFGTVASLAAL